MKQGDKYILSTEGRYGGETWWRQEGCQGGYWGDGRHIEVYGWIEQSQPWPQMTGSLLDLWVLSWSESRNIYVHKVNDWDDADEYAEVVFVIRPNLRTWFGLWRAGALGIFKK